MYLYHVWLGFGLGEVETFIAHTWQCKSQCVYLSINVSSAIDWLSAQVVPSLLHILHTGIHSTPQDPEQGKLVNR